MVTAAQVALRAQRGELGPWRAVQVFCFAAATGCSFLLWKNTDTLHIISSTKIANSQEPDVISTSMLCVFRCVFSTISLLLVYCLVMGEPFVMSLLTFPNSKIKGCVEIKLSGLSRLTTFSAWSWMLMTLYLLGVTTCSVLALAGTSQEDSLLLQLFCTLLWILYGISLTSSLLVTVIVTFVLVPESLKTRSPAILNWKSLVIHNCNVFFMATELLFNDLPLNFNHFPFAILYCLSYAVFSWWWLRRTGMIYYPFLDPSIPSFKSLFIHIALLATFFCMFVISYVISSCTSKFDLIFRAIMVYGGCVYITYTPIHPWYKGWF